MKVKVGDSVKQVYESRNVLQKCCRDTSLSEVVKTPILEQDPPNHKIDGGLCLHPLPQPQRMVSLLHSHPSIQKKKMTMGLKPDYDFSCF